MKHAEEEVDIKSLGDPTLLFDLWFLGKEVGWNNFGDPPTLFTFDKKATWYYYSDKCEAVSFTFDQVIVFAIHGFAGTSYSVGFKCGDQKVNTPNDLAVIAPSIEELQAKLLTRVNQEILHITEKRLPDLQKEIENINSLSL